MFLICTYKHIFLYYFIDVLGVAQWRWVANDDTCGICRVAFEACCPDCKFAGDDCPLGKFYN